MSDPIPPGPSLYAAAASRRRRTRVTRIAGAIGALAIVAGGGYLAVTAASSSVVQPASLTYASVDQAPPCVREQLRTVNTSVQRSHMAAAIIDVPGTEQVLLREGISQGFGWRGVRRVEVLQAQPDTPLPAEFPLWSGIKPEFDFPGPGRYLAALFSFETPLGPDGIRGESVWDYVYPFFDVDGEHLVVTCADHTAARIPLSDTGKWLGKEAPVDRPGPVPSGAASTDRK